MYVHEHSRVFILPEPTPPRWRRILSSIAEGFRAWRNQRAVASLLDLDDRMLRDIGLTRHDVTSALAGRRTEDPSMRLANRAGERRMARLAAGRETRTQGTKMRAEVRAVRLG